MESGGIDEPLLTSVLEGSEWSYPWSGRYAAGK
jgi:hypothetical protein